MHSTSQITELDASTFQIRWRGHYDAIFIDRNLDESPFRIKSWNVVCIGAPAYYFDFSLNPLTEEQRQHLLIYEGMERAIIKSGDSELVGFLRNGPHRNPSIFHSKCVTAAALQQMRQRAVDGFDLHIFSRSEAWGLAISWEEEIALVGGSTDFIAYFRSAAGGQEAFDADFERSTKYLCELGREKAEWVSKLRALMRPISKR